MKTFTIHTYFTRTIYRSDQTKKVTTRGAGNRLEKEGIYTEYTARKSCSIQRR
jgi:hypothetical protein